jgi:SAM-dependent methyltransferase
MRDYSNIDRYITSLYQDIYEQPEDTGHTQLAQKVIDRWMSGMTSCHSVLDVGAGVGFCQPMFEKWNVDYYGIALGDDVVKAQELGRMVRRMDFSFLEFYDNSFDLIFSRHSLEHSPMPILTLMEWARVSRSWLGLVLPHPDWYGYKGKNHYSVMNLEQIKFLLDRAGWYVIWENIDQLLFEEGRPETSRNHEIWLMCEKRRK